MVIKLLKLFGIKEGFVKYFLSGSFWVLFEQAVEMLCGIGITVILARFLSKEMYGQYQYMISIFTIISLLSIPGLNTSVLRSIAQGFEGTYSKGARISFKGSLIGSFVLIGIGGYFVTRSNASVGKGLIISSLLFPFYYGLNFWITYLQAKAKFKILAIFSTILAVTNFIVIFMITILISKSVDLIFIGSLLPVVFFNILFYIKIKSLINKIDEDEGWIKQGFVLSLLTFVSTSYNYIDKLLIGTYLSMSQLAIYSVAVMAVNKIRPLFKSLVRVIFPPLAKMTEENIVKILKRNILLIIGAISIFGLLIYYIIPYVIRILYTDKYSDSIYFSQLYLLSLPFAFLLTLFSHVFVAIKKENILVIIQVADIIITIALYLVLIPRYGLTGAVISSILYYFIFSALSWYFLTARRRINSFK